MAASELMCKFISAGFANFDSDLMIIKMSLENSS